LKIAFKKRRMSAIVRMPKMRSVEAYLLAVVRGRRNGAVWLRSCSQEAATAIRKSAGVSARDLLRFVHKLMQFGDVRPRQCFPMVKTRQ
jgi:hypothetical protein